MDLRSNTMLPNGNLAIDIEKCIIESRIAMW
jgi:hypothetical protein